jgi:predicted anti-sigma-YlaC factor YlaD
VNSENAKLSCKEAARLMSNRQDRALSDAETEELKNHLLNCLSCRNFSDQLSFLRNLAKSYGHGSPPPEDAPA